MTIIYNKGGNIIKSQLNYASFTFSTASPTLLLSLDRVQYAGIRIITGALKCTRNEMLEAEALIMPLNLRRQFLGLTYLGRSARLESSITSAIFTNHYNFQFYEHRNFPLPWIGIAHKLLDEIDINYGDIAKINPNT